MRASEEHHRHDEQTHELLRVLEQKSQEMSDITASELDGAETMLKDRNEALVAAQEEVVAVRAELDRHVGSSTNFVRNYRVLDLQNGEELERFTTDYEVAPWTAAKRMAGRKIQHYDLQEQQPDGAWLPYNSD
ncbi:hypothetical protein [Arthrobacter sp. NPDC056727]|uniref:hypothetical protein n=1 Tax=Arthrobacter sp. NPDC056727 TaxID=3345927 RepID=UPI00366D5253